MDYLGILASALAIIAGFISVLGALLPNVRDRSILTKNNEEFTPPITLANMRQDVINAPDEISSLIALEQYDKAAYRLYVKAGYRVKDSRASLLVTSVSLFIVIGLIFICLVFRPSDDKINLILMIESILLTLLWAYTLISSVIKSTRYRCKYNKAIKKLRKQVAMENQRKYSLESHYGFLAITVALVLLSVFLFLSGMFIQRFFPLL